MYFTGLLRTAANYLWTCNNFAMNVYKWMNYKYTLFGNFTDLATAFF